MKIFDELLDRYALAEGQAKSEAERAGIETSIWNEFGVEQTAFVLDMAGFSRLVQKHGVVHYLSMVRRMRVAVEPIVNRHDGSVVKFEADNCFARFPLPENGVEAGIAINKTMAGMNLLTPDEPGIHVAIGIDFGKFLLIQKTDFFGEAVNLASKLGEDIAEAGEILITDRALKMVPEGKFDSDKVSVLVSGVRIVANRIGY